MYSDVSVTSSRGSLTGEESHGCYGELRNVTDTINQEQMGVTLLQHWHSNEKCCFLRTCNCKKDTLLSAEKDCTVAICHHWVSRAQALTKIQAPAIVEALVCCMCFLHTITLSEGPQICENPPISVPCQKLLRPHSRGSMLHVLFAHNHTFQRPTQNRNCNFITLCSVT